MTPEQVTLVEQTFAEVAPVAAEAAEAFYGRLFEVAPTDDSLESVFEYLVSRR